MNLLQIWKGLLTDVRAYLGVEGTMSGQKSNSLASLKSSFLSSISVSSISIVLPHVSFLGLLSGGKVQVNLESFCSEISKVRFLWLQSV